MAVFFYMIAKDFLQPAFILHTRPFRDTSLLVELFTLSQGRITVIARGVRTTKSKLRGLLMPFIPLVASWRGKSELQTLSKVEPAAAAYDLTGNSLLSGMYLNELIMKSLHQHDPHPKLYRAYQDTLQQLQDSNNISIVLRRVEKLLLAEIGYGLQLNKTASGEVISNSQFYCYEHEHGFVLSAQQTGNNLFIGQSLLAFHNNHFSSISELKDARRLMRIVIDKLLAAHPLKSRELL